MEEESKRHIQMPTKMTNTKVLKPKDLLVYVCIKSFMNKDTLEAFPSLNTIVKISSVAKPTVLKAIEKLKQENYLSVRKEGRRNIYKFNPHKNFEVFSYDFLNKEDLNSTEKATIIALQENMIKDNGFGKTTYSYTEMSNNINMSYNTVVKTMGSLEEKGYLDVIPTNAKDPYTGLMKKEKIFYLNELGQAIVFTLQKHHEEIQENKEKTKVNTEDIDTLKKQVKILINETKRLNKIIEGENKDSIQL